MERLLQFDLITNVDASETNLTGDGDFYRYKVSGRSRSTLISNLCEGYKEAAVARAIELEAIRRTIEQFDEEQQRIDDF